MKLFATFLLAFVLHLAVGWTWTIAAAVSGGYWAGRGGWMVGAGALLLDWLVLIAYSFAVDWAATAEMTHVMGRLFGNIPAFIFVVLTLLVGGIWGALGGGLGAELRKLSSAHRLSK